MRAIPRARPSLAIGLCSITLLALALSPVPARSQPALVRAHVRIVVLGRFHRPWLAVVESELERALDVEATLDPVVVPLPQSAFYAPRRRYRAERLTEFLIARFQALAPTTRILGLTDRDISTDAHGHEDWGILGLASSVPGRAAVVSSFRVRRRAHSATHARWRLTTTAVHETGHVLGLPHCPEELCLMRDAEGTMDTVDAGDGQLGPACRALVERVAPRRVARDQAP